MSDQQIHISLVVPPTTGGFNGKRVWQVEGTGALYVWSETNGKYEAQSSGGGGGGTYPYTAGGQVAVSRGSDAAVVERNNNAAVFVNIPNPTEPAPGWLDCGPIGQILVSGGSNASPFWADAPGNFKGTVGAGSGTGFQAVQQTLNGGQPIHTLDAGSRAVRIIDPPNLSAPGYDQNDAQVVAFGPAPDVASTPHYSYFELHVNRLVTDSQYGIVTSVGQPSTYPTVSYMAAYVTSDGRVHIGSYNAGGSPVLVRDGMLLSVPLKEGDVLGFTVDITNQTLVAVSHNGAVKTSFQDTFFNYHNLSDWTWPAGQHPFPFVRMTNQFYNPMVTLVTASDGWRYTPALDWLPEPGFTASWAPTSTGGGSANFVEAPELNFLDPSATPVETRLVPDAADRGIGTDGGPITTSFYEADTYSPNNSLELLSGAVGSSPRSFTNVVTLQVGSNRALMIGHGIVDGSTVNPIVALVDMTTTSTSGLLNYFSLKSSDFGGLTVVGADIYHRTADDLYFVWVLAQFNSNEFRLYCVELEAAYMTGSTAVDPALRYGYTITDSNFAATATPAVNPVYFNKAESDASSNSMNCLYLAFKLAPNTAGQVASSVIFKLTDNGDASQTASIAWMRKMAHATRASDDLNFMRTGHNGNLLTGYRNHLALLDKTTGAIVWQGNYTSPSGEISWTSASDNQLTYDQFIGGTIFAGGSFLPLVAKIDPTNGTILWAKYYQLNASGYPQFQTPTAFVTQDRAIIGCSGDKGLVSLSFDYNTGALVGGENLFAVLDTTDTVALSYAVGPLNSGSGASSDDVVLLGANIQDSRPIGAPLNYGLELRVTSTGKTTRKTLPLLNGSIDIVVTVPADLLFASVNNPSLARAAGSMTNTAYSNTDVALNEGTGDTTLLTDDVVELTHTTLSGPIDHQARKGIAGYSLDICTPHGVAEGGGVSRSQTHFIVDTDGSWHLGDFGHDAATVTAGTLGQVLTSQGPGHQPKWDSLAIGTQYVEVAVGQEQNPLLEAFLDTPIATAYYAQGFDVVAGANASTAGGISGVTFSAITAGTWTGATQMTLSANATYSVMFDLLVDFGTSMFSGYIDFGFGLWLPGDDPNVVDTFPVVWIPATSPSIDNVKYRVSQTATMKLSAGSYVLAIGYRGIPTLADISGGTQTKMRKRTFRLTKH